MVEDVFKFMTLVIMGSLVFTVLTHSSETATVLGAGFSGLNDTAKTIQGR